MEHAQLLIFSVIKVSGFIAPLIFIGVHLLRPIFFMPVVVICMAGGVLFGAWSGVLYSLIGMTLTSVSFYVGMKRMPTFFSKLSAIKKKWLGERVQFSFSQIALLRLIPFMHFHLISLCILEMSSSFKEYAKNSFFTNIPLAVVYTTFGQSIRNLSPQLMAMMCLLFILLFLSLRKRNFVYAWADFFEIKKV